MKRVRVAFDVDYDETKMDSDDAAGHVQSLIQTARFSVAEDAAHYSKHDDCKVCEMLENDARLVLSLTISDPIIIPV